jgi:hypothetical protein
VSTAQDRLATFVEWVKASSARRPAPLGRDWIDPGPYAVFVPHSLSLPPPPSFGPRHLPIWIPAEQAIPNLPTFNQPEPENQDHAPKRLRHVLWTFADGRFEGAVLGLTDPAEPLQAVLDRKLPGLDLTAVPVLFVPLWTLGPADRSWASAQVPVLRQ